MKTENEKLRQSFLILFAIMTCIIVIVATFIISYQYDPTSKYFIPKVSNNVSSATTDNKLKYMQLKFQDIEMNYSRTGLVNFSKSEEVIALEGSDVKVGLGDVIAKNDIIYVDGEFSYLAKDIGRIEDIKCGESDITIYIQYLYNSTVSIEIPALHYMSMREDSDSDFLLFYDNGHSLSYKTMTVFYNEHNLSYEVTFGGLGKLLISGCSINANIKYNIYDNVLLLDKRCTVSLEGKNLLARRISFNHDKIIITEELMQVTGEYGQYFFIKNTNYAGRNYLYYIGNDNWHLI